MTVRDVGEILDYFVCARLAHTNSSVRVSVGNHLYSIKDINAVIDVDTNKPNIVIHVDDK